MLAVACWAWRGATPLARAVRAPLAAAAGVVSLAMRARTAAYGRGWLLRRDLPAPAVAVGNLTVGGTGKTPVASWIAGYFLQRGARPGVLLRGGRAWGDEAQVHRHLRPAAVVVEDPDRMAAASIALQCGAQVLVLDDAFQRLDVRPALQILLVSADTFSTPRLFPAGPWREGLSAAARADIIVITRKAAGSGRAAAVLRRMRAAAPRARFALARLTHSRFVPLWGGPAERQLAGQAVLASAGIADHASFIAQLELAGARVQRLDWPDHHRYTPRDVARILAAGRCAARIVITEKDAVKLRGLWPRGQPAPLVATLDLRWERGAARLAAALNGVLEARRPPVYSRRHQT